MRDEELLEDIRNMLEQKEELLASRVLKDQHDDQLVLELETEARVLRYFENYLKGKRNGVLGKKK